MPRHIFTTTSFCAATALIVSVANAHAQDLTSNVALKVVEVSASGEEQLVERNIVRPGEVIEYTLTHENTADTELSGISIMAPIPEGSSIALGREASSAAANFEVQADLDPEVPGLEWSVLPAFRTVIEADGSARKEPLPEIAIEAVRWNLETALLSGETIVNSYRVIVD